jgi:hypothetical protein
LIPQAVGNSRIFSGRCAESRLHFFAVRDDLLALLATAERRGPLTYTRTGNFDRVVCDRFDRGPEIPGLGQAVADSASAGDAFLVTTPDVPVRLRSLDTASGVRRYCIDQLINPDTVVFSPGGMWGQGVVVCGRVATVSDTAIARGIMSRFRSGLKKSFHRVRAYWVGPEALALLRAGHRLTASARSPREFDLAFDPTGGEKDVTSEV